MTAATILVVDDEPDIRESVKDILEDEGYVVVLAEHAQAAREARRVRRPDLILLDVWMPDLDGVSLLREWSERGGLPCPVVMMSGHGTVETAVEATRLGAYDFIEKPISLAKLLLTLERALEAGRLRLENEGLKRQLPNLPEPVGGSRAMQALKQQLERVAQSEAPVLIQGEAGTGKETLARFLHARGTRRAGPFVRVAASALPRERAFVVLSGSEEGENVTYGLLDQAQGGVLYIDAITELESSAQQALAAALEAGSFVREGGGTTVQLDVRVIASSYRDLESEVRHVRFREDLYYQLSVLPVAVPPLRERIDDVPELLEYFADYVCTRDGLPYRRFSVAAQNRLRQHGWPGNLRELRNLVQRLLILGGQGDIEVAEVEQLLGGSLAPPRPARGGEEFAIDYHLPLREARDAFERTYLLQLLKQAAGSVGKLATLAGMERTHLYRKLRDLGIDIKNASREGSR
jgi:DNA-binding NtrC family response regulator